MDTLGVAPTLEERQARHETIYAKGHAAGIADVMEALRAKGRFSKVGYQAAADFIEREFGAASSSLEARRVALEIRRSV